MAGFNLTFCILAEKLPELLSRQLKSFDQAIISLCYYRRLHIDDDSALSTMGQSTVNEQFLVSAHFGRPP
jgi:hypothetical protein